MWHVGIDLHKKTVVIAAVHDSGEARKALTIACRDTDAIQEAMRALMPFRAVVEASATYRWLYKLLSPFGTVLLAHPLKLRSMIQRRSKTDKLDAMLLANLLRIEQVPLSYIPTEEYQFLRDVTRYRVQLGRLLTTAKIQMRALLRRHNQESPYVNVWCKRGLGWLSKQDFGPADNWVRDDLLARFECYRRQVVAVEQRLVEVRERYPQVEVLLDIHGIGLYSALLIVAELGEVERFRTAKQVGAYTGLTARVHQSGGHCYYGHISKQGSPWLRWVLIEAAVKAIRHDTGLRNFYRRIRKRSSAKIARVAVARKLGEICWRRLCRWHCTQAA
jgi:transposase